MTSRTAMRGRCSVAVLGIATLVTCGFAQPERGVAFPDVAAALARGDTQEAIALLAPAVARGEPAARAVRGMLCVHLRDHTCDLAEIVRWLTPPATSGNPDAQHALAVALLRHDPSNIKASMDWLEKAAEANHAAALLDLGHAMVAGGRPERLARGAALIRRAAEQGHPHAQFILGGFHDAGKAVRRDSQEAIRWYTAASEAGHPLAQVELGAIYEQGRGVRIDASTAERWYRAAAKAGLREGQYRLGLMYMLGEVIEPQYFDGILWLQRAAKAGHARAQDALGRAYAHGVGVRQSPEEAVRWFERAAGQGLPVAQHNLATLHEHNVYVMDPKAAADWYTRAAKAGYEPSMISLGDLYRRGHGVAANLATAQAWYARAANSRDPAIAAEARRRMQSSLGDAVQTGLAMFGAGKRFPTVEEVFFAVLASGIASSVLFPEANRPLDPDLRAAFEETDRQNRASLQRLQEITNDGMLMGR